MFVVVPDEPFVDGPHIVTSVAIDVAGNISQSVERFFEIKTITADTALEGEMGKMRIISYRDAPNPFDPKRTTNSIELAVEIDSVKGLQGASPNHEYFLLTKRLIKDPETQEPKATIYGATSLDKQVSGSQLAWVDDQWDGKSDEDMRECLSLDDTECYPLLDPQPISMVAGLPPVCAYMCAKAACSRDASVWEVNGDKCANQKRSAFAAGDCK